MTIQKLDLLFRYFYDNKDKINQSLLFDTIKDDFSNIASTVSTKELLILLYKLVDDGYVTKKPSIQTDTVNGEVIKKKSKPLFYISFDGILLIESLPKGYEFEPYRYLHEIEKKRKKEETITNIPKKYWWIYEPLKIIIPLIIGYIIGARKSDPPDIIQVTKKQVVQPMPKTQDTSDKHL